MSNAALAIVSEPDPRVRQVLRVELSHANWTVLVAGDADEVDRSPEFLRDPYWSLRAARELEQSISWPVQYLRAAPQGTLPREPIESPLPTRRASV